jgi:hypothetical protein
MKQAYQWSVRWSYFCFICIMRSGTCHTNKQRNVSSYAKKVHNRTTEIMRLCISCKVADAVHTLHVQNLVSSIHFLPWVWLTLHAESFQRTKYSFSYSSNAPSFTASDQSLSRPDKPTTGFCPELYEPSKHIHTYFIKTNFNINFQSTSSTVKCSRNLRLSNQNVTYLFPRHICPSFGELLHRERHPLSRTSSARSTDRPIPVATRSKA